ncbi:MAG TPA: TetR/AcrR family transcriptional regulator [Acidimicrobiales bacterium]
MSGASTTASDQAERYHHGDLRRALMDAAVASVAEGGPGAVSLRALAAAVGVSHAAPVHHFGDKAGLFTAVATEGFELLADELTRVWEETGDFLATGVRYVHFALHHKGYFEVMFRPDLFDGDDPGLVEAQRRSFARLHDPVASGRRAKDPQSVRLAGLASWSTAHGLATLLLSGNLPDVDRAGSDALARDVLAHLRVV